MAKRPQPQGPSLFDSVTEGCACDLNAVPCTPACQCPCHTAGDVACDACGLPYRLHPMSYHRSWDGQPYLHRLCDGGLVHL